MRYRPTWRNTWAYVVSLALVAVLGWVAFVNGDRIPLLAAADLGFHELGHMLAMLMPEKVMFLAGSGTQIAVPLGLAGYFFLFRKELLATGLMLGWAGTSMQDVSVYIADAPYQRLPLIGGQHDWAFLLGSRGFNVLDQADAIARMVWVLGLITLVGGALMLCYAPVRTWLDERVELRERRLQARAPVRRVRRYDHD